MDGEGCYKSNGACVESPCEQGWEGSTCTKAMCGQDQCGWYGECVAPNQCRCPRKYTRVIKRDADDNVVEVLRTVFYTDDFSEKTVLK